MNFYKIASFVFFLSLSFLQHVYGTPQDDGLELRCVSVGQGSLSIMTLGKKVFIYDAGTCSFKNEGAMQKIEQQRIAQDSACVSAPATSSEVSLEGLEPFCGKEESKENSPPRILVTKEAPPSVKGLLLKKTLSKEKDATEESLLGPAKEMITACANHVQCVMCSHPDKDHMSLFPSLLDQVTIRYLILSGEPSKYMKEESKEGKEDKFMSLLKKKYDGGTTIILPYFSSLDGQGHYLSYKKEEKNPLNGESFAFASADYPFEKVFLPSEDLEENGYKLAEAYYTGEEESQKPYDDRFGDALNYGAPYKITVLSGNAGHRLVGGTVVNMSLPSDSNTSSLVIKVSQGKKPNRSIILAGDMNGVTSKVVEAQYKKTPWMLKAGIYVAAHHGAISEASNNLKFMGNVSPCVVIASHGLRYGHPTEEAYGVFKQVTSLAKFQEPHSVCTSSNQNKSNEYSFSQIHRAFFSTLTNGTITVKFDRQDIKINTSLDQKRYLVGQELTTPPSSGEKETEESYTITLDEPQEVSHETMTAGGAKRQLFSNAP